ncbi:hypothetical protein J3R30DRAFT_3696912 [Lentinula aciculospora]|uniref:HMG box domain-containing protein n=1 Tax=Lentinula aciculospora TaxID=153920 RepID=A0A9W9DTS9_9AGAR|nr:hypothetical protein J3R30DRAFT_3696912 [Lentinula aciculospora]
MPAHRSIDEYPRRSRRLSRQGPKSYDEDGFEQFEVTDIFRYPSEPASVDTSASDFPPPSPSTPSNCRSEPYPPTRTSHVKRKGDDHIPRPPNSFMVYRMYWCKENKTCPIVETDHRQVSRIAAQRWNLMSEEERRPFKQEAEARKRQHALQYPGYKYAPGTRKSNKPRKKVSRDDNQAEKAKCDKIVGDFFLQKRAPLTLEETEVKSEAPATPELIPTPPPGSPSPNTASVDDYPLVYPLVYPPSPSPEGFIPTNDIPPLDLSPPICKVEVGEEESKFVFTNNFEGELLDFNYDSTWTSTTTDSPLGFPIPITPFPSETSFDDCLGFPGTTDIFLWNSTPPPASPLFDPALLASESHSDYILGYSDVFPTPCGDAIYDQYFNINL